MAVPGFEPGSSGPQPLMLTTTLYHHGCNSKIQYILNKMIFNLNIQWNTSHTSLIVFRLVTYISNINFLNYGVCFIVCHLVVFGYMFLVWFSVFFFCVMYLIFVFRVFCCSMFFVVSLRCVYSLCFFLFVFLYASLFMYSSHKCMILNLGIP